MMARMRFKLRMGLDSPSLTPDQLTGAHLAQGTCENGIYQLHPPLTSSIPKVAALGVRTSTINWHSRLGHPSPKTSSSIISRFRLPILHKSISLNTDCVSCNVSKSHRLSFGDSSFRTNTPLEFLYADLWGPAPVLSHDGCRYFLLIVDLFTRYCWVYTLNAKSQVQIIFPQFRGLVEKQFHLPIRNFYTDNGGEFLSLKPYLITHGITWLTTAPHTPQQNGISERRNRHILEITRTLLHHANLPQQFWSFAVQTAVYLINRTPTPVLSNRSAFEVLFKKEPNYLKLRTFGCICFPWLRPYFPGKLNFPSKPCIFVGYSTTQSAYKCFDPETGRIFVSRHVKFSEFTFWSANAVAIDTSLLDKPSSLDILRPQTRDIIPTAPISSPWQSSSTSPIIATIHGPSQSHIPAETQQTEPTHTMAHSPPRELNPNLDNNTLPSRTHTMTTRAQNNIHKPKHLFSATKHPLLDGIEPTCVSQALANPQWRMAMAVEFTALQKHGTWELVSPPSHANIVGCKWVFRIKYKPDGTVDKYKARLVAKGFHQRPGVDYTETFSPVIKPVTIRTVLTLALSSNWPLHQLDISNAFLHGNLNEPVYMSQPPGFVDPVKSSHVCLLRKSLYGLRQAPRAWYQALSSSLISFGFQQSRADTSLFTYRRDTIRLLVLVYVDDLIITGSSSTHIASITRHLQSSFAVKDLGPLSFFLGVEVASCKEGLFLSQHKYTVDLLRKHNMDGSKPLRTPTNTTSTPATGSIDVTEYRSAVGGLQYLTLTRPDISFTVNRLAQSMSAPTATHWNAVKRLFRYLKGTIHHGLLLRRSTKLHLTAYSDSDFGGNLVDGKSTSAYIVFLGHNPISWRSRKQTGVARSSTEAEYRALASAASEVCWIVHLFRELGLSISVKPRLLCDNMGATRLALHPVQHSRMKHIAIDIHFVRDLSSQGLLDVSYVNTIDQLADLLTKPLPRARFETLRSKISVADGTSILRGRIKEIPPTQPIT